MCIMQTQNPPAEQDDGAHFTSTAASDLQDISAAVTSAFVHSFVRGSHILPGLEHCQAQNIFVYAFYTLTPKPHQSPNHYSVPGARMYMK